MSPAFRKKISAYRERKKKDRTYKWIETILDMTGEYGPVERPLWSTLWAMGIEIRPAEFLNSTALFLPLCPVNYLCRLTPGNYDGLLFDCRTDAGRFFSHL
jgi:hypothetical protein